MGKAWEEVAPQIWEFFQNGVQVKMIRVGGKKKSADLEEARTHKLNIWSQSAKQSAQSLARSFHWKN